MDKLPPFKILFVDSHLLIVEKPIGLPTQVSVNHLHSLEQLAKDWIKFTYQKLGNVFLIPLHRLDRVASGLVIFARSSKALGRCQEMMRKQEIKRVYLARVEGKLAETQGKLTHFLRHGSYKAEITSEKHLEAKQAILYFTVVKQQQDFSIVEILLETGRYHQIRAQFSAIGHPIWGDKKYGGEKLPNREGIALHHSRIEFKHPISKEWLIFQSWPDFAEKEKAAILQFAEHLKLQE